MFPRYIWILIACLTPGPVSAAILFNGSLGTTPSAQGWPFVADPFFSHSVTEASTDAGTTFDSFNPISDRGGYFSQDPILGILNLENAPVLDREVGFSVRFHLRIADENHVTGGAGDDNGDGLADRAGFSVIALAADRHGLELSFWEDRIWVQNDDQEGMELMFTQAESIQMDTTARSHAYELRVRGDSYLLYAEENVLPVLSGRLRNYQNFEGTLDPYEIPNFLFFGDNTTRGESRVEIGLIAAGELNPRCDEIDGIVRTVAEGLQDLSHDMTGDGLVNFADVQRWLEVAGPFYLGDGTTYKPGDANLDGRVDVIDFNIWNDHRGMRTDSWCRGDFNADGWTAAGDFPIWHANVFGGPALLGVPEPNVGYLAGVILLLWLFPAARTLRFE